MTPWWHFWDLRSGLAGGVIGGLIFAIIIGALAFYLMRGRK